MESELWIVVELDTYNDCGIDVFSGVMGPYDKDAAIARANHLNKRNFVGMSFRAVPVKRTTHHTDEMTR